MAFSPAQMVARRAATSKQQAKKRAFLWQYKQNLGCGVCGETDPVVLELDHVSPETKTRNSKNGGRGTLIWHRLSWKQIEEELLKCQVLCANCHRRKTYNGVIYDFESFTDERGRWRRWRSVGWGPAKPPLPPPFDPHTGPPGHLHQTVHIHRMVNMHGQ